MSPDFIDTAMTVGGKREYSSGDLGRFGLGLKAASFSQARRLTVLTRTVDGPAVGRRWTLEGDLQGFHCDKVPSEFAQQELDRDWRIPFTGSGTVVRWDGVTGFPATSDPARVEAFVSRTAVNVRNTWDWYSTGSLRPAGSRWLSMSRMSALSFPDLDSLWRRSIPSVSPIRASRLPPRTSKPSTATPRSPLIATSGLADRHCLSSSCRVVQSIGKACTTTVETDCFRQAAGVASCHGSPAPTGSSRDRNRRRHCRPLPNECREVACTPRAGVRSLAELARSSDGASFAQYLEDAEQPSASPANAPATGGA